MKRLEAKVYGWVQGVGFRAYTRRHALPLNLQGFAKNEPDGTVYIVVEGEEENLLKLLDYIKNGPGRVDKVDYKITEAKGEFTGFSIL